MNIQALMMQAQKMQKEIAKKTKEIDEKEFDFSYQNDSILIKIKGSGELINIKIVDALVDPDDKITLEEMICEAINFATQEVKKQKDQLTSKLMPKGMGGMPGLF